MSYQMPVRCDAGRLYAAVASLPCQRCGKHGSQVAQIELLNGEKT